MEEYTLRYTLCVPGINAPIMGTITHKSLAYLANAVYELWVLYEVNLEDNTPTLWVCEVLNSRGHTLDSDCCIKGQWHWGSLMTYFEDEDEGYVEEKWREGLRYPEHDPA